MIYKKKTELKYFKRSLALSSTSHYLTLFVLFCIVFSYLDFSLSKYKLEKTQENFYILNFNSVLNIKLTFSGIWKSGNQEKCHKEKVLITYLSWAENCTLELFFHNIDPFEILQDFILNFWHNLDMVVLMEVVPKVFFSFCLKKKKLIKLSWNLYDQEITFSWIFYHMVSFLVGRFLVSDT